MTPTNKYSSKYDAGSGKMPAHERDLLSENSTRRRAAAQPPAESEHPDALPLMTPILIHTDSGDHRQGRVHQNLIDNGTEFCYTTEAAQGETRYTRYLAAAITEIKRGVPTTECAICGAVIYTAHMTSTVMRSPDA